MAEIAGQAVISGKSLYELVHDGPGTWTMDRAYDTAKAHYAMQQEINEEIAAIAAELSQAWRGAAAEGAEGATQPLRDGATISADALQSAHLVHARQGQHFATIHREMNPLADDPPQTGTWDSLTPWDTDTEQALQEYHSASSRNVELYEGYSRTTDSSVSSMPQVFGVFPRFAGEFAVEHDAASGPPAASAADTAIVPQATSTPVEHSAPERTGSEGAPPPVDSSGPDPESATARSTAGGPAPSSAGEAATGQATVRQGSTGPVPQTVEAATQPVGQTSTAAAGAMNRVLPVTGETSPVVGLPDGDERETTRRGAIPGPTIGSSPTPVPERAAATVPVPRGAAGGSPGSVPRVVPSAAVEPTGRTGSAGAPIGSSARNQPAEDAEYQRKTVLEEPDVQGVFGADQQTPPSVIGDDQDR